MSRLKKGAAVTAALIAMVGSFEGLRTYAYRDPVGIPTICFGETRGVEMGDKATVAECKAMLGNRLIEFSAGVDKCLKVYVADQPYMAFVSFAYNVGNGAFCTSTLARKANAGDLVGACNELSKWTKATGPGGIRIELPGLVKRRAEERALCLSGVKPS